MFITQYDMYDKILYTKSKLYITLVVTNKGLFKMSVMYE